MRLARLLLAAAVLAAPSVGSPGGGAAATGPQLRRIGTFDQPVYVAAPAGDRTRVFVVERPGRIRVLVKGRLLRRPVLDITDKVTADGERGLLSMAFSPRLRTDRLFYVNYTDRRGDTRIVAYRFKRRQPNRAAAGSARLLLRIEQPYSNHNGGQLQFGPDRKLYIGMGDGGGAGDPDRNAQNLGSLLGKLLRIDPRPGRGSPYRIPRSNPFTGTAGARDEIYSYGLRNPWRFSFDRDTGALIIADVGQNEREEVDFAVRGGARGANYGWPAFEGTRRFAADPAPGAVPPVLEIDHAGGWCSITGGYVVRDRASSLFGRYVYGDFCAGEVRSAALGSMPAGDSDTGLRVDDLVSFGEDGRGRLHAVSLGGAVYRIRG